MTAGRAGFGPGNPDPLRHLPEDLEIPREEGGPVFAEPWEARIFALTVDLNARGYFAWREFQALLADEIRESEEHGGGRAYYENWARATERLLERLGLSARIETDSEIERLRPDDRTIRHREAESRSRSVRR